MINVVEHEDAYRISFPYDFELKELVKATPGRSWNPDEKFWSIPKANLGVLLQNFRGTKFEPLVRIYSNENINIDQTLEPTATIPDIDISDVKTYVKDGGKLYSHQLDFMKYAIDRQNRGIKSGFIVGDEPGAGKTLESINLALYNREKYGFKHCLIICCVNVSKYNWMKEISEHTNGQFEGYILGTRISKRGIVKYTGSSKDKLKDLITGMKYGEKKYGPLPYFLILNVEALRMKSGRTFDITTVLLDMINIDKSLNMIIIDEVHKNTSPQSQQGQQLLKLRTKAKSPVMFLPMTGTPIVNRPTDLFLSLRLIEAHNINSFSLWRKSYCIDGGYDGYDVIGYKNLDTLKSTLQANMLRRLKKDILDLPDKIEMVEYVQNTPYQDKLTKAVVLELLDQQEHILTSPNPLAQMLRLRQVNGAPELVDQDLKIDNQYLSKNAKLQRLLDIVADIIDRDEKVVIFSNWVEPLRTVYKYLASKYKVCAFTGTMSEKDRQNHKEVFLSNPEYKIIVGTIGALGTTHTLTSANNIIFYDEPWTAADRLQAIDRVHRISTIRNINIYTLISKNTIDERVHDILYSKEMTSNYIVDGKLDVYKNPELFNYLVGK